MMVAWHEMPGTGTIEIRPVGYGVIRAGVIGFQHKATCLGPES